MSEHVELSDKTLQAIAAAVAKAMPPVPPSIPVAGPMVKVAREKHNALAVTGLVVSMLTVFGAAGGAWITSSNNAARQDVKIDNGANERLQIRTRLDALEESKQASSDSSTKLNDLKESFDQFRVQYRDDTRDLKQQVQELQAQARKR